MVTWNELIVMEIVIDIERYERVGFVKSFTIEYHMAIGCLHIPFVDKCIMAAFNVELERSKILYRSKIIYK